MTSPADVRLLLHADLAAAPSLDALEQVRLKYMGKKGLVKDLLGRVKEIGAGERAVYAAAVNALRDEAEALLAARKESLQRAAREAGFRAAAVDVTLPGDRQRPGTVHPVTAAEAVLMEVMRSLGFQATYGPEVETEYFCFDALNIPKHHPARDMQDTFYLPRRGVVLRTHTTSVQARTLATGKSPIKVASLGRVYRNETVDPQHLAVFHQFEGIWIEEGLTFAHLKGLLAYLARRLYGESRALRFKPKYYPYTEPSVGLDVSCAVCGGSGVAGAEHRR